MRQGLLGAGLDLQRAGYEVRRRSGGWVVKLSAGLDTLVVRTSSPFPDVRSLVKGWEVGLLLRLRDLVEPPQITMDRVRNLENELATFARGSSRQKTRG